MLTLKGPIELKTKRPFTGSFEGFYERIEGNYSVIGSKIEAEDLLHLVTSPPEIFIEEGGDINYLNENAVYNGQAEKIEIVNNLMNRIVVDADYGLTYQDRVFITSVLKKLGVTDVSSFMKKVENIRFETLSSAKLTNDYFAELSNQVQRIENLVLSPQEERRAEEEAITEKEKSFFISVMDRLKTAEIYQIIRNFSDTTVNNTISESLTRNSEQNFITSQVLLNSLREDVEGERIPLTYRSEEYYQEAEGDTEEILESNVTKALSAEILFDIVKNLYHATFDKTEYREGKSFDYTKNFYRLGDNVLSKINYRADGSLYYDYHDIIEAAGDEFESALTIFTETSENNEERAEYLSNLKKTIENFAGETYENRIRVENMEAVTKEGATIVSENNENNEIVSGEVTVLKNEAEQGAVNTETLEKELREINERNIRNRDRYREIFTELKRKAALKSRDGRTLTKQEALKALSDRNYRPDEEAVEDVLPGERDMMMEALRETIIEFPGDEVNILEIMENYGAGRLGQMAQTGSINAVQSLISDIKKVETVYREEPDIEHEAEKAGARAAKRIVEEAAPLQQRAKARVRETEEIVPVSFIHKAETTLSEEEIRESLDEIRRSVNQQKTETEVVTQNIISNQKKKEMNIEEVGADMRKPAQKTEAEIEAMINRGVKSQMAKISDQVMNRLAKKLSTDRARRGF